MPYVATGEVTTLEHELGNDAVERRASVAEALLAGAESTEVLSGLGDNIVEEVEVDATGLLWKGGETSQYESGKKAGLLRCKSGRQILR